MSIDSFRLVNFKSHPDSRFSCQDVNVFVGKNGSGKTNILEALYLLMNAKPIPGNSIVDCVRNGEESVFTSLSILRDSLPITFGISYDAAKKRGNYLLQGAPVSRPKYLQTLEKRAVLFSPIEMNILYLGPDGRRDFLDEILLLSFPAFTKIKSEYSRILKQRNKALKHIAEGKMQKEDLGFWNTALANAATPYYEHRIRLIDFIHSENGFLSGLLEDKYSLGFSYETKVDLKDIRGSILSYLIEKQERDLILGYTYIGPHLDDFSFHIQVASGMKRSQEYLSRGENKTLLLGLKLLGIRFLESHTISEICVLLDDFFSELDREHVDFILRACARYQIFLTDQNGAVFSLGEREVVTHNII